MSNVLATSIRPPIIEGQARAVSGGPGDVRRQLVEAAGVTLLGESGQMARLELNGREVILRAVRFVTRASGRHRRHLSCYLVGVYRGPGGGLRWLEVFLGVVEGARSGLFRLRVGLQRRLLRVAAALLSPGLGAFQKLAAVL